MKALPSARLALLLCVVSCAARQTRDVAPSPGPAQRPVADAASASLAAVTLPALPGWTDKYAEQNEGDMRFFDIDGLMQTHDLSRAQAVEVQNHYRDLSRGGEGEPGSWFETALQRARRGEYEDNRSRDRLREARFIVVFDLDETLYDQYYDDDVASKCHDVTLTGDDGTTHRFKTAPGWQSAIERIAALGGAVALFSANRDDTNWTNLTHWTLGEQSLAEHPALAAIYTNSHLVLQSKEHGDPVVEPSKDLRIFDEDLRRVIIIDDNPERLFQFRNVRVTHKFDAQAYCNADPDSEARRAFEQTLPTVVGEIEDSIAYADQNGVDFAAAFLPYSVLGRLAVRWAIGAGMSPDEARRWVRTHPDVVPEAF